MKKTTEKQVQIPLSLLMRLFRYFFIEPTKEDHKAIENALNDKLEAMARRETYTLSKTAETEQEREQARQKYLDMIGMHKDWRW